MRYLVKLHGTGTVDGHKRDCYVVYDSYGPYGIVWPEPGVCATKAAAKQAAAEFNANMGGQGGD